MGSHLRVARDARKNFVGVVVETVVETVVGSAGTSAVVRVGTGTRRGRRSAGGRGRVGGGLSMMCLVTCGREPCPAPEMQRSGPNRLRNYRVNLVTAGP